MAACCRAETGRERKKKKKKEKRKRERSSRDRYRKKKKVCPSFCRSLLLPWLPFFFPYTIIPPPRHLQRIIIPTPNTKQTNNNQEKPHPQRKKSNHGFVLAFHPTPRKKKEIEVS